MMRKKKYFDLLDKNLKDIYENQTPEEVFDFRNEKITAKFHVSIEKTANKEAEKTLKIIRKVIDKLPLSGTKKDIKLQKKIQAFIVKDMLGQLSEKSNIDDIYEVSHKKVSEISSLKAFKDFELKEHHPKHVPAFPKEAGVGSLFGKTFVANVKSYTSSFKFYFAKFKGVRLSQGDSSSYSPDSLKEDLSWIAVYKIKKELLRQTAYLLNRGYIEEFCIIKPEYKNHPICQDV